MSLYAVEIRVATTGSAGSATGQADSGDFITGFLEAVEVIPGAGMPATTDLVLTELLGAGRTLFSLADIAAAGMYYPRIGVHSTTAAALTYDGTRPVTTRLPILGRKVRAAVVQCDQLALALTVILHIDR